jgi:hypothetical protein
MNENTKQDDEPNGVTVTELHLDERGEYVPEFDGDEGLANITSEELEAESEVVS